MTVALAMRSSIGLSVLHDRAPLFVRLPDGDLRNGYTVKIVNKAPDRWRCSSCAPRAWTARCWPKPDEGLGPAAGLA